MEGLSTEAVSEGVERKKGRHKNVAEGRFVVPSNWPKWSKRCHAKKKNGQPCSKWAVVGMPTCKYHGSGGLNNQLLGELRYLSWIIVGGPQDMPVEKACRVALATFAEYALNNGNATLDQRLRAAMWLTERLDEH